MKTRATIQLDRYLQHIQVNHNLICKFDCYGWAVYLSNKGNYAVRQSKSKVKIAGSGTYKGRRCSTNQERMAYMENVIAILSVIEDRVGLCHASDGLFQMFVSSMQRLKNDQQN